MSQWEPFVPRCPKVRVRETSCCGEFELCCEGGQYVVLRQTDNGYEETGRGSRVRTLAVWHELIARHRHQKFAL